MVLASGCGKGYWNLMFNGYKVLDLQDIKIVNFTLCYCITIKKWKNETAVQTEVFR